MLLIKASTAETVKPISLNGIDSNHTKGHTTKASIAMGQLSRNRTPHPMSNNSAFMGSGLVRYNSDSVQRYQCWRLIA